MVSKIHSKINTFISAISKNTLIHNSVEKVQLSIPEFYNFRYL